MFTKEELDKLEAGANRSLIKTLGKVEPFPPTGSVLTPRCQITLAILTSMLIGGMYENCSDGDLISSATALADKLIATLGEEQ